ncbi:MAG: hypothetical protein WAU45_16220 [Blastocatellia bacterium]
MRAIETNTNDNVLSRRRWPLRALQTSVIGIILICEMLQDKDPEKAKRVMGAMLQMDKIDIKTLKQAYEDNRGFDDNIQALKGDET